MSEAQALAAALKSVFAKNESAETNIAGWLDTSYPPLNEILSSDPKRGLPYGRMTEIFGPPSSGKTWLALQIMISCQKAGGIVIFMDHEYAFDLQLAAKSGLNIEYPYFCYDRPGTWEESNTKAMQIAKAVRDSKVLPAGAPILAVFDSVAAMIPISQLYDKTGKRREIDTMTMNDTTALARVSSTTLKMVNLFGTENNVCTIYLNQIRTKPGVVYGDPTGTPGGVSFEFYATHRLGLTRSMDKDKDKDVVGQTITITTKKNKICRPFQKVEANLIFPKEGGAEFDRVAGLVTALIAKGKLQKDGKSVVWIDGTKSYEKDLVARIKKEDAYQTLVDLYCSS